jgi:ATP-binding cassette subfamily F protein uup
VGANVQVAYFDQQREQLDPERTLVDTIGDGNETVTVGGQPRHVHGYLEDFLFPPDRARSKVKALSGGERSRLLLARLFTRPANVLVLDEPTNDLDIETLELLEERLAEFAGTVLIVSHDRKFLDNVVTSTLAFEGGGTIREYVGGYEDWVRQRNTELVTQVKQVTQVKPVKQAKPVKQVKKLSFKEQRELESLPARIEALEAEERALQDHIAAPGFYREGAEIIRQTLARAEEVSRERQQAYARWVQLDERS